MRRSKYTIEFEKRFGYIQTRTLMNLKRVFRVKRKDIEAVFQRGIGAFYTNPSSVRSSVNSAIQWAYARTFKFLLNVLLYRQGKFNKIPKGPGSDFIYVKSSGELNDYLPKEL